MAAAKLWAGSINVGKDLNYYFKGLQTSSLQDESFFSRE